MPAAPSLDYLFDFESRWDEALKAVLSQLGLPVHTAFDPGKIVRKGDEKGFFRFGGSSFITMFEPGRVRFADDLLEHSAAGREVYAKMGEAAAFATT